MMRTAPFFGLLLLATLGRPDPARAETFQLEAGFQRPSFFSDPAVATRARGDSQGRLYVSGDLTGAGGQRLGRIIRVDAATGAVDPTFAPGGSLAAVRAFVVDSSDRLLVSAVLAGESTPDGNAERIVRLLPDGSIDPTFQSPRFAAPITLLSETTGGKVLAVVPASAGTFGLVRLSADGSPDPSFTLLYLNNIRTEPVTDSAGRILIGGGFNLPPYRGIIRLLPNGAPDPAFTPPDGLIIQAIGTDAIALQSNGKIVLLGFGYRVNGSGSSMLRLLPDGAFDTTFAATSLRRSRSLVVLPDNRLLVANNRVQRIGANGGSTSFSVPSLDPQSLNLPAHALTRLANGQVILATGDYRGRALAPGGGTVGSLCSFDPNGVATAGFTAPALDLEAYGVQLTLQGGAWLASGNFDRAGSSAGSPVVRLRLDGTADPTFTGPGGLPLWQRTVSLATDPAGNIFAAFAEDFTAANFRTPSRLVRLGVNGALEATFEPTPPISAGAVVQTQPDGKVLVARAFFDVQGVVDGVPPIRRFQADGSVDPTWLGLSGLMGVVHHAPDSQIVSEVFMAGAELLAVYPEGRLLASVYPANAPSISLTRLLPDGSFDPSFTPYAVAIEQNATAGLVDHGPDLGLLSALVYQPHHRVFDSVDLGPDRSIVIAGALDPAAGRNVPRLAKLRPDGTPDASFSVGTGPTLASGLTARVHRVRFAPDGKIWVLGHFDRFNGVSVQGIVRLQANGALDATASFPVGWADYGAASADVGFELDGRVFLTGAFAAPGEKIPFAVVKLQGAPLSPLPTATPAPIPTPTPTPLSTPTPNATPTPGGPTPTPTPTPTPSPRPARLVNVSTRLAAGSGDNVPIAGFVVRGSARVAIRTLGPSLADFGVTNVLPDPAFELRDAGGFLLTSNDDWAAATDGSAGVLSALGLAPTNPRESGIYRALPEGTFTVIVKGANGATGTCLVEVYEDVTIPGTRLVNLSTRGPVGIGDRVMIAGFVISGDAPRRFLIRCLGPSLAPLGVPNVLADPVLRVNAGQTVLAENDSWQATQAAEIAATSFAPGSPAECAIIVTLTAGSYTAIVSGKNETEGNAIVEVYELP